MIVNRYLPLVQFNSNLIKDEIRELNSKGVSIIFSTHRMEQVEEMCDHIVLINKGKNVLEGKVKDIRQQFKDNIFKIEYSGELPADLANSAFDLHSNTDREITLQVNESGDSNEILRYLIQRGVHIQSFNEILPTINEIFIKRVGESN